MKTPLWTTRITLYFALIGIAELVIFFRNPGHFFMGDTLVWMGLRYRSVGEFLKGFITLDPSLWYRPLAQRTVESLLYPLAGLHPIPYRLVTFVLFFACTIAVFILTERVTESRRAAWIATLFFAPQVTHAFTTYDAAFSPEMIFTLFYVGAVVAWVKYLRTQSRKALIVSVVLLAGSLMSKETAAGLPFMLLAVWLFLPQTNRARLRSLAPHFVILVIYLVFTIGFLHIRAIDVRQLIGKPGTAGQSGGYQLVLGKNVVDSAGMAFSWAFGVPRGKYGEWPMPAPWMLGVLKAVRLLIYGCALFALFTPSRRFLLIGMAWFLITVGPTLPLLDHFFPYYVFAPLVGFSLAVGASLDCVYAWCAGVAPRLAFASCAVLLIVFAGINASAAPLVAAKSMLLGESSDVAAAGMNDLRALYPSLPKGVTLIIFSEDQPDISWDYAYGMLFQMAYQDESIKTQYTGDDFRISNDALNSGKVLAFKSIRGRLLDYTSFVKQRPELLLPHNPHEHYRLELSKSDIRAGEVYRVKVSELQEATLNVLRAYNGIVEDPFQITLDHHGSAEFKTDSETKTGEYTFVAFQRVGEPNWVTVSGSIRVR